MATTARPQRTVPPWTRHHKWIEVDVEDQCISLPPLQRDPRPDQPDRYGLTFSVASVMHEVGYIMFWPDTLVGWSQGWTLAGVWADMLEPSAEVYAYQRQLPTNIKRCFSEMAGMGFASALMRLKHQATNITVVTMYGRGRVPDCRCDMPDGSDARFECKGTASSAGVQRGQLRDALDQLGKSPTGQHPKAWDIAQRQRSASNLAISTYMASSALLRPSRICVVDPERPVPMFSPTQLKAIRWGVSASWAGLREVGLKMAWAAGWLAVELPDVEEVLMQAKKRDLNWRDVWMDPGALDEDPKALYLDDSEVAARLEDANIALAATDLQRVGGIEYAVGQPFPIFGGYEVSVGVALSGLESAVAADVHSVEMIERQHVEKPIEEYDDAVVVSRGPAGTVLIFGDRDAIPVPRPDN